MYMSGLYTVHRSTTICHSFIDRVSESLAPRWSVGTGMSAQESFGSFGALDSALEAPLGLQHDLESISQQPHTTTAASASQTQPLTPGPLSVQPRPSSSLSSSHLSRRNPREEKRDERQSHYQTLKQRGITCTTTFAHM